MLVNKRKSAGLKHYNDSKALTEYSNLLYPFLVNNTSLLSDDALIFWQNFLERIYNKSKKAMKILKMKNYDVILKKKKQKHQHYYQTKLININITFWSNSNSTTS